MEYIQLIWYARGYHAARTGNRRLTPDTSSLYQALYEEGYQAGVGDEEFSDFIGGLEEHFCKHEWVHTGSAYGGDDDSYHGEGRVYCTKCGADGDA